MDYDRIIAINNDSAVYRHGDKSIKVFIQEKEFTNLLEESFKTQKVKEQTSLNIAQIYDVSLKDGRASVVAEYIEGDTLAQKLKNNSLSEKDIVSKLIHLQNNIHSYSGILNCSLKGDTSANPVLCHGALTLENIVQTTDGRLFVLNWGSAFEGDKNIDVAFTYYELLYNFKQTAKLYINEYIKTTCEQKENLTNAFSFALNYLKNNSKGDKQRFYSQL